MKKSICLILSVIIILSTVLAACTANNSTNANKDNNSSVDNGTTKNALEDAGNEFGVETVEVTDKNGETVTDKNGSPVTSTVFVEYSTNKNGDTVGVEIDNDGKHVTDSKGNEITVAVKDETTTKTKPNSSTTSTTERSNSDNTTTAKVVTTDTKVPGTPDVPTTQPTTASTTMTTKKHAGTTSPELTTIKREKEVVPKTTDSGEKVIFSSKDQQIIKSMLEVPYLYESSYENSEGVPTNIATHAAIWMVQREAINTSTYASTTVVLDLFKFYAQTVVNFKTHCNDANNENIKYNSKNDTFVISSFEAPTHTVKLKEIENLGNNNYYKVTATVEGTNKATKVVAIIQKNMLDTTLGFSIKALKWS